MSSLFDCILIIGCSTVLSVLGMVITRKRFSREKLESCHEVGGVLLAIVGTLYAILVGLIVVNSQARVDAASQMAVSEANMLSNIFHLAKTFEQPAQKNIRRSIYDYAAVVIEEDWAQIEEGKRDEATKAPYQKLWHEITSYVPKAENDSASYSVMLSNIEELSAARKYRMIVAKGGLSPVLWAVLVAGGVMIVLFTYFFFLESLLAQTVMTAFVAIFLSMNVYLIYICQNPYRPELGAKKAGFGYSFNPNWFKESP